jgi:hypothetical protein
MCDSKELLVGYLYDEIETADRRAFEAHLRHCAECANELRGLKGTRGQIASWAPPEPDLGLRIVRGGAPAAAPRVRFVPAWGLAAAAALVLAASAAIANVEVRYGHDGLVVRTGWSRADAQQRADGAAPGANPAGSGARPELVALDERLRQLESSMLRPASADVLQTAQDAGAARMSDGDLLRRVRQLIADAESRQQTEVVSRLAQVIQDVDRQRRTDLAFIQQGLAQYQGLTNAEVAQNRDMLNQLVRVATRQEK